MAVDEKILKMTDTRCSRDTSQQCALWHTAATAENQMNLIWLSKRRIGENLQIGNFNFGKRIYRQIKRLPKLA